MCAVPLEKFSRAGRCSALSIREKKGLKNQQPNKVAQRVNALRGLLSGMIPNSFIAFIFIILGIVNAQSSDYTLVGSKFSNKISNAVNTTFLSPADIITDYTNGLMYVADKFKNRIVYCYLNSTDNCRQYTMTWSTYSSSCSVYSCLTTGATCCSYPYYLKDPTGVAVDTLGNICGLPIE